MAEYRRRYLAVLAVLSGFLGFSAVAATPGSATYTYDGLGRLKSVVYEDGSGQFYSYDPAGNRTTSASGSPVVFSISAGSAVNEGGSVTFTVTKTNNAAVAATVNYATADGSAIAGTNYTATSGTLSFSASQTSQTITVATLNDGKYDGATSFSVVLSQPSEATIGTNTATATINEVNPAPVFSIASNGSVGEGNPSVFTVSRANATSLTETVNYATSDGSAVAGTDYTSASGTLTFAPSDTSHTFSVTTAHRANYEGTRSFTASLSNAGNDAVIGAGGATGTITDVDTAIGFAVNSPATVAAGNPITFTVSMSGGPAGIPFSVNYATSNGSAVAGTDYTAASGTLTFPVGTTSQSVTITTQNPHLDNNLRAFTLGLSNATNSAPITTATGTGSIQSSAVPPAPVLSPSTQTTKTGAYSLSWSVSGGSPTSYKLSQTFSGTTTQVYSGSGTVFSGSVDTWGRYQFTVTACNANGCGPASNTAVVVFQTTQ